MKRILAASLLFALGACAQQTPQQSQQAEAPVVSDAPAGEYRIEPSHADLSFRVSHLGLSMYTARFSKFDATLQFDPANPEAMSIAATIDVGSLTLPSPPQGFTEELLGPAWLNAGQFPEMTFRSTAVEVTGANTARVTGDFTMHGVTKPVTLDVRFNGGYAGHPMDPNGRIGFSADGVLKRSDFGVSIGVPPPGSTMGVGDEVLFTIETELTGPPWAGAGPANPG